MSDVLLNGITSDEGGGSSKRGGSSLTTLNQSTTPDPELVERPKRRRFTAKYKLRILEEAEACTQTGEIGALLRREGLYTSHLSAWRKQREGMVVFSLDTPICGDHLYRPK